MGNYSDFDLDIRSGEPAAITSKACEVLWEMATASLDYCGKISELICQQMHVQWDVQAILVLHVIHIVELHVVELDN